MPDPSANGADTDAPGASSRRSKTPVRLLKGTAVLTAVLGAGLVGWIIDKALRYPQIRASQLGAVAPLWVPFAVFITIGVALIVRLFWRAAQRVEAGEDLFAKRHRRRPSEEEN